MYVYIWKDTHGTPFYVGFTKNKRRTNPRNSGNRNWLCRQKLTEIGVEHVIVELRPVFSVDEGTTLECALITEYGRIQLGTGPLTNLREGGEGVYTRTPEQRERARKTLLDPAHPVHSKESRARSKARMQEPDVQEKFRGDNNPAKRPEVREKIKAVWRDPEFKAKQSAARVGKAKNFSEEDLQRRREALIHNPAMKGWGERNGIDPEFDAKRIAGIKAAQPKRAEKMRDPEALAQRKARLKATLTSEEYKARRALWDTPEFRARQSAAKKLYWEKRKANI